MSLKDRRRAYIDFEYNGTTEERLNLVSVCIATETPYGSADYASYWLHGNSEAKTNLKRHLKALRDDYTFVAFNVVAEASAFIALGLDPTKFVWIDLAAEWKMLTNHWHKYAYGKQLIDGVKKVTRPPAGKYEQTEEERKKADSSKPPRNLAGALYKMLGIEIDTAEKDRMRDLIISAPDTFTAEEQNDIIRYNMTDVEPLIPLRKAIIKAYNESAPHRHGEMKLEDIVYRGETGARAALMSQTGYPVNRRKVERFAASVPAILEDLCVDINKQMPEVKLFEWNRARGAYSMKQKPQTEWIYASKYKDKWMKTEKGAFSLSLDAWAKFFSFKHDYPTGNLPAQILRYLKTKQNLNGFMPTSGKERRNFFDSYGSDGRARPWLNPYGSQSSRYQPQATGFIPLKSAWMRALIEPPEGTVICGIDYASEEFLISAILSGDKNMYESYVSGDPYLSFAKKTGAVPEAGTKDSHPVQRLRYKSTVLGISYLMAKYSLADKLTEDTGEHHTPEDAEALINQFFEVYSAYAAFIDRTLYDYSTRGYLRLPDGWIMFGDNPNHRSISNCPVQGFGACVLRKAVALAQDRGLRVIIPLHDALYIQFPHGQWEKINVLAECMMEAFAFYFKGDEMRARWAKSIRLDADVWGPGLKDGEMKTPAGMSAKTQKIYVDPRAKTEYERFSKYFL